MGHHKMQGLPLVFYCFKDRTWSNASIFWLLQGHKVWLILPMTFISTSFINHKSFIFVGEFLIHHCQNQCNSLQIWSEKILAPLTADHILAGLASSSYRAGGHLPHLPKLVAPVRGPAVWQTLQWWKARRQNWNHWFWSRKTDCF